MLLCSLDAEMRFWIKQSQLNTHILFTFNVMLHIFNTVSHKDIVTCLGWNPSNELYTCSDDKTIWKWNMEGEPITEIVKDTETYVTDMSWIPPKREIGSDVFAVSCSDGKQW